MPHKQQLSPPETMHSTTNLSTIPTTPSAAALAASSAQPVDWQVIFNHNSSSDDQNDLLLIGQWATTTSHLGIRAVPFSSSSPQSLKCCPSPSPDFTSSTTPLIHITKCRLTIRSAPYKSIKQYLDHSNPTSRIEIEEVAIHRDVVSGFLSHLRLPSSESGGGQGKMISHYDDEDEWVYSRCTLAGFTEMSRDEATFLSNNGMLCCWTTVVLSPREEGEGEWDLGFVIHRVAHCTESLEGQTQTKEEDEENAESCAECVY